MQQRSFALSYIIPTYNKRPHLTKLLETLRTHKAENEEIVVIDGGSKDGTPQYLQELLARGEIDAYICEPDKSLGHAVNKGFLMARGELLKNLNDDDVYFWDEMKKCKEFMLAHPKIDALGTNGIESSGNEYHREEDFLLWKKGPYHPFMILELGLMLRRSSIAIFGLADTSFTFWDPEFTIRLTAGKARLAWYTGIAWKHTLNSDSISRSKPEIWRAESARLRQMYPGLYSTWKHHVPKPLRDLIRSVIPKKRLATPEQRAAPTFLF